MLEKLPDQTAATATSGINQKSRFRVAIVGGGIGGLVLANSLQHAGIDFTLCEKGEVLDPQVGASIGILPNGARILDQLGCFDDLTRLTASMEFTASHAADGSLIGEVSDTLKLMERRTGYPVIFLDRQWLLRVLARHLIDHDNKVRLSTRVQTVDQNDERAILRCEDGTTVEADIVVGSDGVHSVVRQEMWRQAEVSGTDEKFAQDREAITAEYKCLFGISAKIPGMQPGQTDRTYANGLSTLSYVGKEGRVFWFVFIKMDRVYRPPYTPSFSKKDIANLITEVGSLSIRHSEKVTIADLYDAKVCCSLVAIEEADFQHWSHGRLVCLGDAVHKMTPNLGAGASSAIESAAVLSNIIVRLASQPQTPTSSTINQAFQKYQDARALRVRRAMGFSNKLTRIQALQTKRDYIFTHFISPRMDDTAAEAFSSFVIGAPVVDYLPIPARSLQGTMPFNPKQGWGFEQPVSIRIRRALPLISMSLLSFACLFPACGSLFRAMTPEHYQRDSEYMDIRYQDTALPRMLSSVQSGVVYGLWLLEATRLNNKATLAQFPLLLGLAAQLLGLKVVLPLYLALLYIQSPVAKFRASDNRLTDVSYIYSVGPSIVFLDLMPKLINLWIPAADVNTMWPRIVGLQPFLISIFQYLIATYVRPSTIRRDRLDAVRRDSVSIRHTTRLLASMSCISWCANVVATVVNFKYAFSTISVGTSFTACSFTPSSSFYMANKVLLGSDGIYLASAAAIWLVLVFRDLRDAGMMSSSWGTILSFGAAALLCCGPAGLLITGWQWREHILLTCRHKDAVVSNH